MAFSSRCYLIYTKLKLEDKSEAEEKVEDGVVGASNKK
jgi:hypothetical protein